MYCSREVFRERGSTPAYAVTKATGRCLSWRKGGVRLDLSACWWTSGVAVSELPASETAALVPKGHGPGLRACALSLPDAPGASGCRHHLILVPGKIHGCPPSAPIPISESSPPHPAPLPVSYPLGFSRVPPPPGLPSSLPLFHFSSSLPCSQDSNIQACLPLRFTPEEYDKQDIQ